jgi:Xaa-Pro aminopeptidase
MNVYQEKAQQACALLPEFDLDLWITYVRETAEHTDPVLKLLGPFSPTWPAAFIFTRSGEKVAISGKGDDEAIRREAIFDEVIPYTQSIKDVLVPYIEKATPQRIGVNYSQSDVSADGLTYGMYLNLQSYLAATPYAGRLVSAEDFIEALRGRKTPQELATMRKASAIAMEIFDIVSDWIKPGVSEKEIYAFVHGLVDERGLDTAWDPGHCPGLNAGPNSPWGHVGVSDETVKPGETLNMDFGVTVDGFCSDNQRTWYVLRPEEEKAPEEVQVVFNAVRDGIQAAADAVQPGVKGWEVDAVARKFITDAGYEEYPHALGHSVGRYAHDGGTGFYPRWERYGTKPYGTIHAGNVFTLEFGVRSPFGYISMEEEILVTEAGYEWMSPPQKELLYIQG